MWLKAAGSALIVLSGSYIGYRLAFKCKQRPKQIRQIMVCLASLKTYINYVGLPLPEALTKCVNGIQGPIADLFLETSRKLKERGWLTPREALEESWMQQQGNLALESPERELISILGANLGLVNREEQYKYISVVEVQLQKIEQEANRYKDQNAKMYQYLGVCGSLAVVILLI